MDGSGDEYDIAAMAPTYPIKNFHIGGLPDGPLRRDALQRLEKNDVIIDKNFYGCMHSLEVETIDEYRNRKVSE